MIKAYKDKHCGERVFIIGNGPSLANTPLEKLSDEYTISMNNINLIFEDTPWRPKYYLFYDIAYGCADDRIKNAKEAVSKADNSFIPYSGEAKFRNFENVCFFNANNISKNLQNEDLVIKQKAIESGNVDLLWSRDASNKINNFGSTISAAAQLAHYMGFNEIYFLGTDLYDESQSYRPIFSSAQDPAIFSFGSDSLPQQLVEYYRNSDKKIRSLINIFFYGIEEKLPITTITNKASHHFTSNYTKRDLKSVRKLNQNLIQTHKVISLASEKMGFEVYNATIGGSLEVYDRVKLNDVL